MNNQNAIVSTTTLQPVKQKPRSLSELHKQLEALQTELQEARTLAKKEAVDKFKALGSEYEMSLAEIATAAGLSVGVTRPEKRASSGAGSKVITRYRHNEHAWSGRGMMPVYFRELFKDKTAEQRAEYETPEYKESRK